MGKNTLDWKFRATVDVTTGFLYWKKTETVEVFKNYIGNWFFTDTGKFTPDDVVEELARSYQAKRGKALQYCMDD